MRKGEGGRVSRSVGDADEDEEKKADRVITHVEPGKELKEEAEERDRAKAPGAAGMCVL